ncbi:MAG: YitT family protein [Butyrivibrio sp.]|nr:YitT family protein [Butyrivibrio sp.]
MENNNLIKRIIGVVIASFILALNVKTFVHTGGLIPGGAMGLSLLIQQVVLSFAGIVIPYTAISLLLNAIPVYIGFRFIGKKFTWLSLLAIVCSSIFTDLLPEHIITQDILLISIFGGLMNGFAISICLLLDATSGGTDFISIYLSEKNGIDSFNIILGFNAVILTIAGALFGWDKALYSIIFQFTSTIVIRLLYRKYQKNTLFVVTNKPEVVSALIYELSNHGATILEGKGSYEHCERNVVYSVISSAETRKVVSGIKKADPEAFVNVFKTDWVDGQFYSRPED